MITVGIFIYPDIQALDLAGALDCFGQANQELLAAGRAPYYRYCVIGLNTAPLFAENGLQLTAQYSLDTCPQLDYLVIPGGAGARTLTANQDFIRWLCQRSTETENIISICTGA